jgi:hypothetical protein
VVAFWWRNKRMSEIIKLAMFITKNPEINNSRLPHWFNFPYFIIVPSINMPLIDIFDSCCVWISSISKTEARGNLSNLFHRKCSLNLNSTDIEITNYCVYQYKIYIYIYILALNRIHTMAAIISSFFYYICANLQSTPPGAISKCVNRAGLEGRSHPAMTFRRTQ